MSNLATTKQGSGANGLPTLVLMHFLGGSQREWDEVLTLLGPEQASLTVDLPGFGGSAEVTGYSVAEMADAVAEAVKDQTNFVLVGHSMSGKVSAVLASRGLPGLQGLVMVAPSPPGPEPMDDEKRNGMIAMLGHKYDGDLERAKKYITKNEERDIAPAVLERAATEVLRMNRTAWVAWLTHGSKEDWADRVGVLHLPALVVAGEKDRSLGPAQQREKTLPHLGQGIMIVVEGCSHLVPLERPAELAVILTEFVRGLKMQTKVPAEYVKFMEGERVSAPTRAVLEKRMAGPAATDGLLTAEQERILRAVMARVVPGTGVDLAGFVMARLATGKGDGWRYDVLPDDAQAYRDGLDRLAKDGFAEMSAEDQDAALTKLAAKKGSVDARWFEEVRGDATAAYVSHPQTMARIGFSGPGVGGAFTKHRGFVDLGYNSREEWEPLPVLAPEVQR